ncbi:transposase [Actinomyces massiliensis]|jgi:transposase IS116/IS110/IS902 family protein|uniref:transposase n=1 Tax=Actinomyces massiliensis TaxID=461393 RepID=UPI0028EA23E3|nr:transposase [Actinomyces massiliensis]
MKRADGITYIRTRQMARLLLPGPYHPCPGSGVPAVAALLAEALSKALGTGIELASNTGLAAVTRKPGASMRGEYVSHAGNKRLKYVMFDSAFASLRSDPVSRACYQRRSEQGKCHDQSVITLAHRRILTLPAMIRDGAPTPAPAAQLPLPLDSHMGMPLLEERYLLYRNSL